MNAKVVLADGTDMGAAGTRLETAVGKLPESNLPPGATLVVADGRVIHHEPLRPEDLMTLTIRRKRRWLYERG